MSRVMQFIEATSVTKLKDLADRVGDRLVEAVLATNELTRAANLIPQIKAKEETASKDPKVTTARMKIVLNNFTQHSDIFEFAALSDDESWKYLSKYGVIPGYLKLPETVEIPSAADVIGNGIPVANTIYKKVQTMLDAVPFVGIDPGIFNEYSTIRNFQSFRSRAPSSNSAYWFPIPLGEVTLFSTLANEAIDFPCYPEELSDSTTANYAEMPELLYQYEPWKIYTSSGPRSIPFKFSIHRDMWSGDHHDEKARELIRFCESCIYPNYSGSAVYSDKVTFYIHGSSLITGIMSDFSVDWDGPLLDDGYYAHFALGFRITEVSDIALSNSAVRAKPLIG